MLLKLESPANLSGTFKSIKNIVITQINVEIYLN